MKSIIRHYTAAILGFLLLIAFASFNTMNNEHSATPTRASIDSTPTKKNPDSLNPQREEILALTGTRQEFLYLLYVLRQPEPAYKDVVAVTQWIEKNTRVASVDTTKKKNP